MMCIPLVGSYQVTVVYFLCKTAYVNIYADKFERSLSHINFDVKTDQIV